MCAQVSTYFVDKNSCGDGPSVVEDGTLPLGALRVSLGTNNYIYNTIYVCVYMYIYIYVYDRTAAAMGPPWLKMAHCHWEPYASP
jgi:hypothetical protein